LAHRALSLIASSEKAIAVRPYRSMPRLLNEAANLGFGLIA